MADRGGTSAVLTQIAAAENRPVHLIDVEFSGGTEYVTDSFQAITSGGNSYTALGDYVSISEIQESGGIEVSTVTLQLSGVDKDHITNVLGENYIDRPITIAKGFLDTSNALISSPITIFSGRMNAPVITENPDSGTSVVTVTATSHWVDFERRPGRSTNHSLQQIHFSGDKGFEFASEVAQQITWGKSTIDSSGEEDYWVDW